MGLNHAREPFPDRVTSGTPGRRCDGSGPPVSTDSPLDAETLDVGAPEQTAAFRAPGHDRSELALRGELLHPLPRDVQDGRGFFGADQVAIHVG